jgi:hypothetical protein
VTEYETRTTRCCISPIGEPTFSEMATHVEIVDEAAGEYVEVSQYSSEGIGKITIDPEEWPAIRDAIEAMLRICRTYPAADKGQYTRD